MNTLNSLKKKYIHAQRELLLRYFAAVDAAKYLVDTDPATYYHAVDTAEKEYEKDAAATTTIYDTVLQQSQKEAQDEYRKKST